MKTFKYMVALISVGFIAIQVPTIANAQPSDDDAALEEILVTARKTVESLQEVPIAINVISGDFLETARLDDVQDFLIRVPGVGFGQPFKSYTPIAIRGASTQDDSIGVDPNVSVFIDGVYVGSTTAIEFDLMDLERVEVLKGPQGTVFGRNTNGGVIHYVSRTPDEEFRAATSLTIGNDERVEVSGSISGQIADGVFGNVSLRTRNTGGYTENLHTGNSLGQEKVSTGRAKLRFAPSDALDIILSADLSVDQSFGTPRDFTGPRPAGLPASSAFDNTFDDGTVAQDLDGGYDRVTHGLSATVKYDADFGTFHSITAYRDNDSEMLEFDFDALTARTADGLDTTEAFPFQATQLESFSQEFRLDWSAGEAVDVTTGLYYLGERQFRVEHLAASGIAGSSFYGGDLPRDILSQEVDTTSLAVFTDVQFHLSDRVTLSTGVRWSDDKKEGTTVCAQVGGAFCTFVYETSYEDSWSEPTYRIIADYQWSDTLMIYVSYAHGYKSGGFSNGASACCDNVDDTQAQLSQAYLPEFADSYELGMRFQSADGRLTINPTFFYVEYTDVQFLFFNGIDFVGGNFGSAENQGVEIDFNFNLTDDLTFWANYAHQDSEYGPAVLFGEQIGGNQLQLTPKSSFTAGVDYSKELAGGGRVYFSADTVQKSRQYDAANNSLPESTELKNLYNLRLGYAPSERVDVSIWVANLADERFNLGTNTGLDGLVYSDAEIAAGAESIWRTYTPPRTYGATLRWTY